MPLVKNNIYYGDWVEVMRKWQDKCIDMVMTSPPYWALRDYGIEGQLGLEPTFEEYINRLCSGFDEVKRVLKDEGTCWVNMGDNYIDKSLSQAPFQFSIAMANKGWILRNVIIWHKPDCNPESIKDRFTVDFEYLFFFSKKKKYSFRRQFEKTGNEMTEKEYKKLLGRSWHPHKNDPVEGNIKKVKSVVPPQGRNKRCVWRIPKQSFPEAHFATYPEKLCLDPIKSGCPEKGVVLDPFFGSGTTGVVARKLGRDWVGIELSKEYIKIAEKRLSQQALGI